MSDVATETAKRTAKKKRGRPRKRKWTKARRAQFKRTIQARRHSTKTRKNSGSAAEIVDVLIKGDVHQARARTVTILEILD